MRGSGFEPLEHGYVRRIGHLAGREEALAHGVTVSPR